jgi:hypothetical protein
MCGQTRPAVRLWPVPERASAFQEAICRPDCCSGVVDPTRAEEHKLPPRIIDDGYNALTKRVISQQRAAGC